MKTIISSLCGRVAFVAIALAGLLLLPACTSTRVNVEKEIARVRVEEPVLLLKPLSPAPELKRVCESLGKFYQTELPKRVNGRVVYGEDIDTIRDSSDWENLIRNGAIDNREVAAMAANAGCSSVVTCEVLSLHRYPPFRMVIRLKWIDAHTGSLIGKLYQDIDLADTETNYRFRNFAGQGPLKEAYEQFFYSEDLYHTSYLMPKEFRRFVASYSSAVMFQDIYDVPWWIFWRSI